MAERKQQRKTRFSSDNYLKVFQSSPDPSTISELDDGRLLDVNKAFVEFTGKKKTELLGRGSVDLGLWEYPQERAHIADVLRDKGKVSNVEFTARVQGKVRSCLFSAEIIELDGKALVLSSAKDITELRQVRRMIREKDRELEVKTRQIEEVNEALRLLLTQSKEDAKKLEQRIVANVEDLVLPYVRRLQETPLDADQEVYCSVIESNLTELMAPFMRQIGSKHANLTPREIEVANLVRMGITSKEIAKLLSISKRAVEFHRDSLRKKLGLKKTKRNLRAYLASLS